MIAIVSPSKTMKEEKSKIRTTSPKFISETNILAEELKHYSISDLEKLMGISEELALLSTMSAFRTILMLRSILHYFYSEEMCSEVLTLTPLHQRTFSISTNTLGYFRVFMVY